MKHDRSQALFEQAQKVIPGGVNSPVRAFKSVGGKCFIILADSRNNVISQSIKHLVDFAVR